MFGPLLDFLKQFLEITIHSLCQEFVSYLPLHPLLLTAETIYAMILWLHVTIYMIK